MPDEIGLLGTEERQRAGTEALSLSDGDRRAGQGSADVHGLDLDIQRLVAISAAGENGVYGLQHLLLVDGACRHDGLSQELSPEHDIARTLDEVLGPEPPRRRHLEIERFQEP